MRKLLKSGAPGEIRTPDLLLRRQSLYPAELRARTDKLSLQGSGKAFNAELKGEARKAGQNASARLDGFHRGQRARRSH